MHDWQIRTKMLLGDGAAERLNRASVVLFGLGGVGGQAAEALARAGIGALTLVDHDVIAPSNINRQILADLTTVGRPKAELASERIAAINPECRVNSVKMFAGEDNINVILPDGLKVDYIIDAIDTVASKAAIIGRAHALGIPLISCMGTGGKLDPLRFVIGELAGSAVCPLARAVRRALRSRGFEAPVEALYSTEPPRSSAVEALGGRHAPGSVSYVPACAGLMLAGRVIRGIAGV